MGRGAPILIVLLLAVVGGLAWVALGGLDDPGAAGPGGSSTGLGLVDDGRADPDLDPSRAPDPAAGADRTGDGRSPASLGRTSAGDPAPLVGGGLADSSPGTVTDPDPKARPLEKHEVLYYGWLRLGGKPVAGADVVLGQGSERVAAATVTNANGYFEVVGYQQTDHRLTATAPGIFPVELVLPEIYSQTRRNLGNVRAWAAEWVTLDIKTTDGAEPAGLWGYSSDLEGAHREPIGIGAMGERLALAPSRGRIVLGAEGYQVSIKRVPSKLDGPLEVTLHPGARLVVQVSDPQGFGIGGAQVFLVPDGYSRSLPSAYSSEHLSTSLIAAAGVIQGTTNDEGLAAFGELSHEGYVVYGQHADYLPARLDFLRQDRRSELDRGLISGSLVPAPRLYVGLRGSDGTVPSGLRAGAYSDQGDRWLDLVPGPDGVIHRTLPHEGRWTVQAWAPGYRVTSTTAVTDYTPELVEQVLPQAVQLRALEGPGVLFVGPDDLPLEGVDLEVTVATEGRPTYEDGKAWRHTWRGVTTAEPALDEPLTSERLLYRAEHEGLLPVEFGSEDWPRKSSGAEDEDPWVVQLVPALELVVQVVDGGGTPVADAVVYLTHSDKTGIAPVRTDERGRCSWDDLPQGHVSAKARGPAGHISTKDETDLTYTATAPARLELVID